MNCAEISGLFAMSRDVTGQNNGARIRVAGSQIVKEFRAQIRDGFGVEHEKIWLRVNDNAVGLGERRSHVDLGGRRSFVKSGVDFLRQLQVRFENKNAAAGGGLVSGMARRRVVHDEIGGGLRPWGLTRHALRDRCLLPWKWKAVFRSPFWRRPALRPQKHRNVQQWRREGAPTPG